MRVRAAILLIVTTAVAAASEHAWVALACALAALATSAFWRQPARIAVASDGAAPALSGDSALIDIDSLGDPALIVGGDRRVVAANAGARQMFGDRVVADDLRLVVRHPAVLDAVAAVDALPVEREIAGLGSDNGAYRVRVTALAATPGARLLSFVDITQARLTERMRADFIANASHELRTPVTTLLGFIETLEGPAADDEPARLRFLEIMHREAARMARLIDDLLSLSRIELDKHVRPQTSLDLAPLIADVGRTLAMRLDADRRRLVIDVADLPPVVADRDQILQVLHNLVSNALKYGRSGTAITVAAAPDPATAGAMVRVTVGDRGDGVAPEHLPRLTERFYRIDTGRSRSLGGTGLGLAIVKHIVERHRGGFDIVSQPGEGSTVGFTLPVATSDSTVTKV